MIKAILKNGVIHPLEPLPEPWPEGQELMVEILPPEDASAEEADWLSEVDQAMADVPAEDHDKLLAAVEAHRKEQKEYMRLRENVSG